MKFSLFFEMQIADPTRQTEAQLFRDSVEQAVLADTLGYDGIWVVEHHGLREYSHSSAPEVFLAYVAARTQRIRLGHGVTLTPQRYNHPLRIAERIATLDILSGGRVNWGSGKSSSLVEQMAFEVSIPQLHEQWLEALEMIPRMWQSDVFEFKGKYYKIPPTQVIPKPVQQPHPPMFAACSKPESAAAVGALGLGALNFAVGSDQYLAEKVRAYREAVGRAKPTGWQKNNHFACSPPTLVLDDDRKSCEYGLRGARFFGESMFQYYLSGTRPIGRLAIPRDFLPEDDLREAMAYRNQPGSPAGYIIGAPEHARESVRRFADAGIDELLMVMQLGTVPHELVMESLRTFAEKVIPHFR
ncbi:LLM class flavin-dependent oxidoreductase [Corallococcus sp. H22C18031201]|nr:LLM class flavin-dependent oxidoreductase [Corallococcus sp. H22C18031201]